MFSLQSVSFFTHKGNTVWALINNKNKANAKIVIKNQTIVKEGGNLYQKNWSDLLMKGTHKHTEANWNILTITDVFLDQKSECMWTHGKDGTILCSHTFTLFWLRTTSVIFGTLWLMLLFCPSWSCTIICIILHYNTYYSVK